VILHEDDDLLVVNKPSGINTHKPGPFAPDGLHEFLTQRHPRWRNLSVIHRLDKETSGVIVFGNSARANQSLTRQFQTHTIHKRYLFLANAPGTRASCRTKSNGAETRFRRLGEHGQYWLFEAEPVTGKTHQVRRHAAENGFPIVGDSEYGGTPAPRLMLHAHAIRLEHPGTGELSTFQASVPRVFDSADPLEAAWEFRQLLFTDSAVTNAYRLISGAGDSLPDVVADWMAGHVLVQWQTQPSDDLASQLRHRLVSDCGALSVHEQVATRHERRTARLTHGTPPDPIIIRENGLNYVVKCGEGLSAGIFLDQRENRRRLAMMNLTGQHVLNTFSYTGAFSVAAAHAGALTTSVDLSRNYLDWGRENFRVNGLDPSAHDFIYGDVFDWLGRFQKRGQHWDVVVVDPPTFSTTKKGRAFQARRDYLDLARQAIKVLKPGGWLLCSTNQRTLSAEDFVSALDEAADGCGRFICERKFVTLPFDFRVGQGMRPYLKTMWMRLE
jgi:23S rRNA (cytosine1962-C5)-methyltransferase